MNTLFVIASPSELDLVEKEFQHLNLKNAGVVITGVGGLNVMNALKDVDKSSQIVNVGYAGSTSIPIGTRVSVGVCQLYHPNARYEEPTYVIGEGVTCYTSNDFVLSAKETDCVFDMELAYILAMGFNRVEAIKYVSDNCNYEEYVKTSGNEK